MCESCPYGPAELADPAELGRHAMQAHREAVRAHLIREGHVSAFLSGQQTLGEVVA